MTLKEETDADEYEWIDIAKKRWHSFGVKNVMVKNLQLYEMNDTDCENIILADKRRSARKIKKIGNIFLLLGTPLFSCFKPIWWEAEGLLLCAIALCVRWHVPRKPASSRDY